MYCMYACMYVLYCNFYVRNVSKSETKELKKFARTNVNVVTLSSLSRL